MASALLSNASLGFGLSLGLTAMRTYPALVRFYADFSRSGLKMAEHRGYGQSACKAYGLIPSPKLSVSSMATSGVAFVLLLLGGTLPLSLPDIARSVLLVGALVAYHLYFSQLYCEAHVGAHVTVLVPPILILLAFSPALAAGADVPPERAVAVAAFTSWMVKVVITSAYCGAGVCKLTKSIRSLCRGGVSWAGGSTLQAFMYEALLLSTPDTHTSFGVPTPYSHALQKLHVCLPRPALAFLSAGPLAFEALAPLLLLAPAHIASVPFALAGIAFHYGIAVLQNIDFVSWWGPAYAFLLADPAAWAGGALFACPADAASLTLSASITAALEAAPLHACLCLAYVGAHVLAVALLRFWPHIEILPFSSFPMFGEPANLFDRALRKWVWLTDKPHATGTLKNYAFPMARPHTVMPDEVTSLPFKYVLFGHGGATAKPDAPNTTLYSNVEMTPQLSSALEKMRVLGSQEQHTFATDPTAMPSLLAALDEAKAAFKMAPKQPTPLPDVPSLASTMDLFESDNQPTKPTELDAAKTHPTTPSPDTVTAGTTTPPDHSLPATNTADLTKRPNDADAAPIAPPPSPKLAPTAIPPSSLTRLATATHLALRLAVIRSAAALVIGAVATLDALLVGMDAARTLGRRAYAASAALLSSPSSSAPPTPSHRPSVVIAGGSFAGLRAKRELAPHADVTLIDTKEYFEYTPGVLRLYVRPDLLPTLTTPLPIASPSATLLVGSLHAVTPKAVTVLKGGTSPKDGTQPEELSLPYDYLLLASGTDYPCQPIRPTTAEPRVADRQRVWDEAAAALRAAASVMVVGGGLVGVELAAEIASTLPSKPVTLLSSGDALCSSMPMAVGESAHAWLTRHHVTVRLHSPVESVDSAQGVVTLKSGETLRAEAVYDCRGNGAPSTASIRFSEGLESALDAKGRVVVDSSLCCVAGGGRIFAMGDVMAAAPSFAPDLKLGHTAELNAEVAAENVKALLLAKSQANGKGKGEGKGEGEAKGEGKDEGEGEGEAAAALVTYPEGAVGSSVAPRVCCISLGEADGVLVFNDLVIPGLLAAIAKPVLEWTKIAACAERPGAVLFWRFGDWAANLLSRTLLKTSPKQPPPPIVTADQTPRAKPTILFDGVCLLCSTFVHFVLDHDATAAFDFAPLQGATGTALLTKAGMPLDVSTMVLIDEEGVHVRSTAALRVLARCGRPYSALRVLLYVLPRPLRDLGYKMVASVRYRLFGKDDGSTCRRMTKAMRQRFHD